MTSRGQRPSTLAHLTGVEHAQGARQCLLWRRRIAIGTRMSKRLLFKFRVGHGGHAFDRHRFRGERLPGCAVLLVRRVCQVEYRFDRVFDLFAQIVVVRGGVGGHDIAFVGIGNLTMPYFRLFRPHHSLVIHLRGNCPFGHPCCCVSRAAASAKLITPPGLRERRCAYCAVNLVQEISLDFFFLLMRKISLHVFASYLKSFGLNT
jgi:hypothetical protein